MENEKKTRSKGTEKLYKVTKSLTKRISTNKQNRRKNQYLSRWASEFILQKLYFLNVLLL